MIESIELSKLKIQKRNARTHTKAQIERIANSIKYFGFTGPILTDSENRNIAGYGRLAAAKKLGLLAVPCERLTTPTDSNKRNKE